MGLPIAAWPCKMSWHLLLLLILILLLLLIFLSPYNLHESDLLGLSEPLDLHHRSLSHGRGRGVEVLLERLDKGLCALELC